MPSAPTTDETRVVCETPTPGKQPTRILKWKYDLVREAILIAVSPSEDGVKFQELSCQVAEDLSEEQLSKLGSVSWYTTTVKLDMEVKGEIERVPGSRSQRIRRVA